MELSEHMCGGTLLTMLLLKVGVGERRCIMGTVRVPHVSPPSSVEGPSAFKRHGHGHVPAVEWIGRVDTRSFKNPMLHLAGTVNENGAMPPDPYPIVNVPPFLFKGDSRVLDPLNGGS